MKLRLSGPDIDVIIRQGYQADMSPLQIYAMVKYVEALLHPPGAIVPPQAVREAVEARGLIIDRR